MLQTWRPVVLRFSGWLEYVFEPHFWLQGGLMGKVCNTLHDIGLEFAARDLWHLE